MEAAFSGICSGAELFVYIEDFLLAGIGVVQGIHQRYYVELTGYGLHC
jgi:hypothetical protein